MSFIFTFFAFGFLASYLGSILGLGGGFILVPLLHLVLGMEMKDAIFFSLASILIISIYHNAKNRALIKENRSFLFPMAFASLGGALLGASIQVRVVSDFLEIAFGILLCAFSLFFVLRKQPAGPRQEKGKLVPVAFQSLAGLLSGLFGIGGGIVSVPILNRYLGFPMKEAAKLSFFLIFISSIFALIFLLQNRKEELMEIPAGFLLALILGALFGAFMATRHRFSNQTLQKIFSAILFIVGLVQILKAWPS